MSTGTIERPRLSGTLVRRHREALGFSQADLAAAIGISAGTVYRIEADRHTNRGQLITSAIADALGVPVERLIREHGPEPTPDNATTTPKESAPPRVKRQGAKPTREKDSQ